MSFYEVLDFLDRLFAELASPESLVILGFLFGAFLIGWLFGRWSLLPKAKRTKRTLKIKEDELVMLAAKHDAIQKQSADQINDLQAVKLELEELHSANDHLEIEKTQIHNQLNIGKDQIAELQSRNSGLLSQIEELHHQMAIMVEDDGEHDEEEELDLDTAGFEEVANLTNNYNNTIDRLSAIENKLAHLEGENKTLKSELSQLKLSADALDSSLNGSDEPADFQQQKMMAGRVAVRNALGVRIPKGSPGKRDKLQRIKGIGPFIEEKLNEIGIYSYDQIRQLDNEMVERVTDAIQFFPGRILRDNWVGQAQALHEVK